MIYQFSFQTVRQIPVCLMILTVVSLSSCRTIPPGTTDGPIITDNPVQELPDRNSAVNRMVLALAMNCPPIANAGRHKPNIMKKPADAGSGFAEMEAELWNSLQDMHLILPVKYSTRTNALILSCRFIPVEKEKGIFAWEVLLTDAGTSRSVWRKKIQFRK